MIEMIPLNVKKPDCSKTNKNFFVINYIPENKFCCVT